MGSAEPMAVLAAVLALFSAAPGAALIIDDPDPGGAPWTRTSVASFAPRYVPRVDAGRERGRAPNTRPLGRHTKRTPSAHVMA